MTGLTATAEGPVPAVTVVVLLVGAVDDRDVVAAVVCNVDLIGDRVDRNGRGPVPTATVVVMLLAPSMTVTSLLESFAT